MEAKDYIVKRIDGDYAILSRIDDSTEDEILVARALLPDQIDEGCKLHWESLEYSIIE
ncbi:MAG: chorismate--pyruvate lyase [Ruminococcus sp.]|nr:chorismate--pyruvate lyase [Ruminococcus sp.]MCD7799771.1 chorismate--pyruvate lyase [Ruminococcus sp.]